MAISIESNRNDYVGDGATSVYPYGFKILAASDLAVTVVDTDNIETDLAYPADFTVSGIGQSSGGNVTLVAGSLTDDFKLTILRIRPLKQTTSIRNETEYYQATIEDALDKLVMIDQQQQEQLDRALKVSLPDGLVFDTTLPIAPEANRMLMISADGLGFALGPTPEELSNASQDVLDAEAAAAAAAVSETNAAASATDADASAAAAATSATDAAASAADAAASAAAAAAGWTAWVTHSITSGQSATDLVGETADSATDSSVDYVFEIIQGTTIFANGTFSLQYINSAWRVSLGVYRGDIHGLTFDLTGTTIAQLRAADSGAGNGTIKLSRRLIPA